MEQKVAMEARVFSRLSLRQFVCYLRGWLLAVFFILHTAVFAGFIICAATIMKSRRITDFLLLVWSRFYLYVCNIKVKVEGLDNLPDGGMIFLFNHTSMLDIPVLHAVIPRSFRFGAKIELFDIPLFGAAMRAAGVLPIDRQHRSKVMHVYQEAEERIARGESFFLAPEGARQYQQELGKFKTGPFIFAVNAKAKVVPVVIIGAYRALPKKELLVNRRMWRSVITVKILTAWDAALYPDEKWQQLQHQTRLQMLEALSGSSF